MKATSEETVGLVSSFGGVILGQLRIGTSFLSVQEPVKLEKCQKRIPSYTIVRMPTIK